ncbi:uncharacterized protein LOC143468192 isoform X2 [Clavelina lepadiformis]|uniref:uncharacterized protein LOC143468192 isoform X2 n=1 Tax=Clavelina lepadiformis TaxID=159417 RepID=UPI0040421764
MPMQLRYSAKTLSDYCLESIAENMENLWCADYKEKFSGQKIRFVIGPFDSLTSGLIKQLTKVLIKKKRLSKLYLHLLISPTLLEIDFSSTVCNKLVNNEIIELVLVRCSNLRTLNLKHCKRISSGKLYELVKAYGHSLEKLIIGDTNYDDNVLNAIGESCLKLVYLDISKFGNVNVEGLKKVFVSSSGQRTEAAKTLQGFAMSCVQFDHTEHFIAMLFLHWCPQLAGFVHESVWEGLANLCEINQGPKSLNWLGERYHLPINVQGFREKGIDMLTMIQCVPRFKDLSIQYVYCEMGIEFVYFTTNCGSMLTSLSLDWTLPFEHLLYVGAACPCLDTIMAHVTDYSSDSSEVKHAFKQHLSSSNEIKPWSKLKQFIFTFHPTLDGADVTPVLKQIVANASETLDYLKLGHYSGPFLNQFLLWGLEMGNLKNISWLDLEYTEIKQVSMITSRTKTWI